MIMEMKVGSEFDVEGDCEDDLVCAVNNYSTNTRGRRGFGRRGMNALGAGTIKPDA